VRDGVRKPVNIARKVMTPRHKRVTLATHRGDLRRNWQMSKAMEQIVQVYVRHQNRRALEDIRKQRQKLALELRACARPGYNFGLPIRQINEEIAVIEAGLERLVIAAKAA
jgi:hypothetical protein